MVSYVVEQLEEEWRNGGMHGSDWGGKEAMEVEESRTNREQKAICIWFSSTAIDLVEDGRGMKPKTPLPESPL